MAANRQGRNVGSKRPRNLNRFHTIDEHIIGEILKKLPAKDFAFATCVCRSWKRVSDEILSRSKLVTGVSLKPRPMDAIKEAMQEVLSKPIRPQFVIASFAMGYNLPIVHDYMKRKFGRSIPIITNSVKGVIGQHVKSQELIEVTKKEVSNEYMDDYCSSDDSKLPIFGLVLIVGWFPDMKIDVIPFISSTRAQKLSQADGVDKFIHDVKTYSVEVSASQSPAAILIFGGTNEAENTRLITKIDGEFTNETAIVGHFSKYIDFRASSRRPQFRRSRYRSLDVVALVFARDRFKAPEIGNTQFHVPCMKSVSQIGSTYNVASINQIDLKKNITYFNGRRDSNGELLNGSSCLCSLEGMDERIYMDDYYIGIEKKTAPKIINKDDASTCAAPQMSSTSISLYSLQLDEDDGLESLVVKGKDIKVGDSFEFYRADFERSLTMEGVVKPHKVQAPHHDAKVIGGLIFANMCETVEWMTRDPLAYSTPFIEQFGEDIPLGGLFSKHIVKHGSILSAWKDVEEQQIGDCSIGHKGTQFLVMSFTPPVPAPPPPIIIED